MGWEEREGERKEEVEGERKESMCDDEWSEREGDRMEVGEEEAHAEKGAEV